MTVQELIEKLKKLPPYLEVVTWDPVEDEYMPVLQAIWEDGDSEVALETFSKD